MFPINLLNLSMLTIVLAIQIGISSGIFPFSAYSEADRPCDGDSDSARDFRLKVLQQTRRRHPRGVRAAVQKRPKDVRLSATRKR